MTTGKWMSLQISLVFLGAALVSGIFTGCSNDKSRVSPGVNIPPNRPQNGAKGPNSKSMVNQQLGSTNNQPSGTDSQNPPASEKVPSGIASDGLRESVRELVKDASAVQVVTNLKVMLEFPKVQVSVYLTINGKSSVAFLTGQIETSPEQIMAAELTSTGSTAITGTLVCADAQANQCWTRIVKLQIADIAAPIYAISRIANADLLELPSLENQTGANGKKVLDIFATEVDEAPKNLQKIILDSSEIIGGATVFRLIAISKQRQIIPVQGELMIGANGEQDVRVPLKVVAEAEDNLDEDGKPYLTDIQKLIKEATLVKNNGAGEFKITFSVEEKGKANQVSAVFGRQTSDVKAFKDLKGLFEKSQP